MTGREFFKQVGIKEEEMPTVGRLPERKTQSQWDRELDAAIEADASLTVEEQLAYYKAKCKRDSWARHEAELELARVQRKARRHRTNIRDVQRAYRLACLERDLLAEKYRSVMNAKDASEARAIKRAIDDEVRKAARTSV